MCTKNKINFFKEKDRLKVIRKKERKKGHIKFKII